MTLSYCGFISATVNYTGSDCPYSLKVVACQLLLEITAFLRETYQHMPRSRTSRQSGVGLEAASYVADRQAGSSSSRRWSFVLGSPGNSERSNSRSSQGDSHGQGSIFWLHLMFCYVNYCQLVGKTFFHILFPSQKPDKVQCNYIWSSRDGGLPEKQVLIKLAAHYHIYMHCSYSNICTRIHTNTR